MTRSNIHRCENYIFDRVDWFLMWFKKSWRRIRSNCIRKDQIFFALFIFLFNRNFALQNRNVIRILTLWFLLLFFWRRYLRCYLFLYWIRDIEVIDWILKYWDENWVLNFRYWFSMLIFNVDFWILNFDIVLILIYRNQISIFVIA